MSTEKYTHLAHVQARVSRDDLALIQEQCDSRKVSLSQWVRELIAHTAEAIRNPPQASAEAPALPEKPARVRPSRAKPTAAAKPKRVRPSRSKSAIAARASEVTGDQS